jgi:hypothetical protein
MPITGLTQYLILWATLGLAAYGAFCLSVTFRGITEDAPLELKVGWWTGRILLGVCSIALLLAVSKGMTALIAWVLQ